MPSFESDAARYKAFSKDKPLTKQLVGYLRFLAKQPSSFVLQQFKTAGCMPNTKDESSNLESFDETHLHDVRRLYRNYELGEYDSPSLFETLQMQLTLRCLTNLTEDGPLKAERRVLELEQELRDVKKKLAEISGDTIKPAAGGIAIDLASDSEQSTAEVSGPVLAEASDLHNRKRKALINEAEPSPQFEMHASENRSQSSRHEMSEDESSSDNWKQPRMKRPRRSLPADLPSDYSTSNSKKPAAVRKRVSVGRGSYAKKKHPTKCMKENLVKLRRPEVKDAWYSNLVPPTHEKWVDWERLDLRRDLSNIGHIEETIAGILADTPCDHCEEHGYECKIYDPEFAERYTGQKAWRTCSRCWTRPTISARSYTPRCSLAKRKSQPLTLKDECFQLSCEGMEDYMKENGLGTYVCPETGWLMDLPERSLAERRAEANARGIAYDEEINQSAADRVQRARDNLQGREYWEAGF